MLTYFVCDIQKHMMTNTVALWSVCVTVLMLVLSVLTCADGMG